MKRKISNLKEKYSSKGAFHRENFAPYIFQG